jgi:Recombination endonuclease VII
MKQCSVCSETKELDQFYNMKSSKDGKGYRCKECDNNARQKWAEKHPERSHLSQRQRNLKHRFGVDLEWYEEQFKKQNYSCAICESKTNKTTGTREFWNFSVDHCHDSGKVRGILCNNCNRALGLLQDSAELLQRAKNYLEK